MYRGARAKRKRSVEVLFRFERFAGLEVWKGGI